MALGRMHCHFFLFTLYVILQNAVVLSVVLMVVILKNVAPMSATQMDVIRLNVILMSAVLKNVLPNAFLINVMAPFKHFA
jgi:hypothetical protein